ncbi:hypothetical protein CSB09_03915 [Candidatus Gracilibacteria bacterium]|nr:MAG: hypothetical protein CSB09_03915 [Candidatus Gracilibacteria bacterium]
MVIFPAVFVASLVAMYGVYSFIPDYIYIFLIFAFIAIVVLYGSFQDKVSIQVKEQILAKMAEKMKDHLSYSPKSEYFPESIHSITNTTGIIDSYDRLDFVQDSIKIEESKQGFTITGVEFQTSKKYTDNKGNTRYKVNNHAYIMKILLHNPKHTIKHSISLFPEVAGSKYIMIFALIANTFLLAVCISVQEWFGALAFGLFVLGSIVAWYYNQKTLVRLENVDFEKEFEVHSSDQVESRKVLTPDFMYRIYDYVNKIDKTRRYSLYFKGNTIYIKFDIFGDFLEISLGKSLIKNLTQYVEFYLEIKNISELANDLKLGFYDKNFSRTTVIQSKNNGASSLK